MVKKLRKDLLKRHNDSQNSGTESFRNFLQMKRAWLFSIRIVNLIKVNSYV